MTSTPPKPQKLVGVNGRGNRIGQDHPNARLTDRDVQLIFELREMGWGYRRIAEKLECSKRHVRDILKGAKRGQHPARFKRVRLT